MQKLFFFRRHPGCRKGGWRQAVCGEEAGSVFPAAGRLKCREKRGQDGGNFVHLPPLSI